MPLFSTSTIKPYPALSIFVPILYYLYIFFYCSKPTFDGLIASIIIEICLELNNN
jgi:hypothetical protein